MPSPTDGAPTERDREVLAAYLILAQKLSRAPSVREVAAQLGVTPTPVQRSLRRLRAAGELPMARARGSAPASSPPPPPPPPPRERAAQPGPPPPLLAATTPDAPSADALEANVQAHRIVLAALVEAARDPELSPRERRREIRALAHTAARLIPQTRLWEAEQLVKADREEITRRASQRGGAKLETLSRAAAPPRPPRPPPPSAAVDEDEDEETSKLEAELERIKGAIRQRLPR